MTPDQAVRHLNCTSTKAFQEIVAKESVPKHYLSDRLPRPLPRRAPRSGEPAPSRNPKSYQFPLLASL